MASGLVGGLGGQGGGSRRGSPPPPSGGGRPAAFCPVPLLSPAHPPQVYAFSWGPGAAPGAGCGLPQAGQPGWRGGVGWLVGCCRYVPALGQGSLGCRPRAAGAA